MLRDKFSEALKEAMRAKDQRRVGTMRLILAALKDKDIEARGAGREKSTDEEILGLLQKMIKQRNDSIEAFDKAGRTELSAQEREENSVLYALRARMAGAPSASAISVTTKRRSPGRGGPRHHST